MSNFTVAVLYAGALLLGVFAFALWQDRRHRHK